MNLLRKYLSERNIRFKYLTEETGYHRGHISRVLNGHTSNSLQFKKLIRQALQKLIDEEREKLQDEFILIEEQQTALDRAMEEI